MCVINVLDKQNDFICPSTVTMNYFPRLCCWRLIIFTRYLYSSTIFTSSPRIEMVLKLTLLFLTQPSLWTCSHLRSGGCFHHSSHRTTYVVMLDLILQLPPFGWLYTASVLPSTVSAQTFTQLFRLDCWLLDVSLDCHFYYSMRFYS